MIKIIYASVIFLSLDILWIGFIAKSIYIDSLKSFLRLSGDSLNPVLLSVLFVYIVLIAGLLLFPIDKAANSAVKALLYGFCFGVVVYGTYDFTNHALINNWPLKTSIIDTIWGGVICGITSSATVYLDNITN